MQIAERSGRMKIWIFGARSYLSPKQIIWLIINYSVHYQKTHANTSKFNPFTELLPQHAPNPIPMETQESYQTITCNQLSERLMDEQPQVLSTSYIGDSKLDGLNDLLDIFCPKADKFSLGEDYGTLENYWKMVILWSRRWYDTSIIIAHLK